MQQPIIEQIAEDGFEIESDATGDNAGYDLRAARGVRLHPNEVEKIGTGVRLHMKTHWNKEPFMGLLVPRSSMGLRGLVIANTVGIIDMSYQGEIIVAIRNVGVETREIGAGDRIAQLIFVPVLTPTFLFVEQFSETTSRGEDGFGSTGV